MVRVQGIYIYIYIGRRLRERIGNTSVTQSRVPFPEEGVDVTSCCDVTGSPHVTSRVLFLSLLLLLLLLVKSWWFSCTLRYILYPDDVTLPLPGHLGCYCMGGKEGRKGLCGRDSGTQEDLFVMNDVNEVVYFG